MIVWMYWGSLAVLWPCLALAAYYTIRGRYLVRRYAADHEFAEWARWTSLTVTDKEGMIYSVTLVQLRHDDNLVDRVWDQPTSVAIWHMGQFAMRESYQKAIDAYQESRITGDGTGRA